MTTADLAVVNADVAVDGPVPADSLAVAADRIIAVGQWRDVAGCCAPRTNVIDAAGAALLPGFVDTHMHLEKIASEMDMVHVEDVRSLDGLMSRVSAARERTAPRDWIRTFGDDRAWNESQLAEARLPFRHELDQVVSDRPVFIYRGPDAAALNSEAASTLAAKLGAYPSGDWSPEHGWLRGPVAREVNEHLPSPGLDQAVGMLRRATDQLLKMGITTIVDPGLPASFARSWSLYQRARADGALPQRLYLMNRLDERLGIDAELDRVERDPAHPGDGDEHLRAWSIKLLLDGEFTDAWMRHDEGTPDAARRRWSTAELVRVVDLCADRGWPLCVHAMGGAAIDSVIETVTKARERGKALRPCQVSIAHAFLASRENAIDCSALGIAVSVQPMLSYAYGSLIRAAWGTLSEHANPIATLLAADAVVAGGSDTLPCEPLRGARYAVDRVDRDGRLLGETEAITPARAISLFTTHGGRYVQQDQVGTLSAGGYADFVLWDRDPVRTPPSSWLGIEPHTVVIDGEVRWSR